MSPVLEVSRGNVREGRNTVKRQPFPFGAPAFPCCLCRHQFRPAPKSKTFFGYGLGSRRFPASTCASNKTPPPIRQWIEPYRNPHNRPPFFVTARLNYGESAISTICFRLPPLFGCLFLFSVLQATPRHVAPAMSSPSASVACTVRQGSPRATHHPSPTYLRAPPPSLRNYP